MRNPCFEVVSKFRVAQEVKNILSTVVRPAQIEDLLSQTITPEDGPSSVVSTTASGNDSPRYERLIRLPSSRRRFFIAHLHLVKAVEQRFPAAASRRWRHATVDP